MRPVARALVIVVPALVGCSRSDRTSGAPAAVTAEPPRDAAVADAAAAAIVRDASAEAPAVPRGGKWSTRPDGKSPLAYVVDGYCAQIRVAPTKAGTFVWWGEGSGTIARVTDRGLADEVALSRDLPGAHDYREITANADGELFVDANTGGRASMSAAIFHRGPKAWDTVIETQFRDDAGFSIYHLLGAYGKGALATVSRCESACVSAGLLAAGEKLPKHLTWDGDAYATAWIGDDQTVVIGGQRCGREPGDKCTCSAKAMLADGTVKVLALDNEPCAVSIVGTGAKNVVLASGAMLARFDGTAWRRIPGPRGTSLRVEAIDASGHAWVSNQASLHREKDGAWEEISPPGGLGDATHGKRIDGVTLGDVWAVTANGGVVRTGGEKIAWTVVPVPLPPFAAIKKPPAVAGIIVSAPGDAWVNVSYGTQYEGTPSVETRRALLRTKMPTETVRCGSRSGRETGAALESWPPRGTAECKNLAVVVAQAAPSNESFPRTRAILKGHDKELGAALDLVVVRTAEPPYVVAPVPSYDVALKLAGLISKKAPFGAVPEIVCAELDSERDRVRVDVTTGDVVGAPDAAR